MSRPRPYKQGGVWVAKRSLNGELRYLGTYPTEAEAQAVIDDDIRDYGMSFRGAEEKISFRVTDEEKAAIEKKARQDGLKVAQFARKATLEASHGT